MIILTDVSLAYFKMWCEATKLGLTAVQWGVMVSTALSTELTKQQKK